MKDEGRGVLLVEHNVDVVREVADYVVVLQGGSVIAAGPCDQVLRMSGSSRSISGGSTMLEVRELRSGYGIFEVLKRVDLARGARPGGGPARPQRRGKVDVAQDGLRIASGAERLGRVRGHRHEPDARAFEKGALGIRLVPQEANVFPNLTIEDNLKIGALKLRGDTCRPGGAHRRNP